MTSTPDHDDHGFASALRLPEPLAPDPSTAPGLRWGVISPGHIADQFTATAHRATQSRIVAVSSRSQERAEEFAGKHGAAGAFGSVEAMLEAGDIDAVYVASPHAQHHQYARAVLEADLPVVVEKAFTLNAPQAEDLFQLAGRRQLFVMEAMWARFLPQYDVLRQVLDSGVLGGIIEVAAEHGQFFEEDAEHRLYAPELGGGALLDLGVYPLSFAQMVVGDLTDPAIQGDLAFTGVDAYVGLLARGARGGRARVATTLQARMPNEAVVVGTDGTARLSGPFYAPGTLTVTLRDGRSARFEHPGPSGDGMAYEIAEAARRITAGDLASPAMTWEDTVSVMRTMDAARTALGVTYPQEEQA